MNEKVKLIMKLIFNLIQFLIESFELCWFFFVIVYSGVFEDISVIKAYRSVNTMAHIFFKCAFWGVLFIIMQYFALTTLSDVVNQIRLIIKYQNNNSD